MLFAKTKPREVKELKPANKLQELAFRKHIYTSTQFGNIMADQGIISYGKAHTMWHSGQAFGDYKVLKKILKFFGKDRVEDVFEE